MIKKKLALLLSGLMLLSACGVTEETTGSVSAAAPVSGSVSTESEQESAAITAATVATITLSGNSITVSGNGATVNGTTVTITQPGNYDVSGELSDGQIIVDAGKEDNVSLTLSGVSISCSTGAPIYVKKASAAELVLADGTENYISDGDTYALEEGEDEPDAAIFSKADLYFTGSGKLTVEGNYNMAIHSKDTVYFYDDGTYDILSAGDGVKGKDRVFITDEVNLTITAGEDGIQSTNKKDASLGDVYIDGGTVSITAGKHGINAETALDVLGGNLTVDAQDDGLHAGTDICFGSPAFDAPTVTITAQCDGVQAGNDLSVLEGVTLDITTGGGAANAPEHVEEFGFPGWFDTQEDSSEETSSSAKGLKCDGNMYIEGSTAGNTITLDCMDDGLHCGGALEIRYGSTLTIASGDDGIHSDDTLEISGGTIHITQSYEGLEAVFITISGGDISLVASDDGLNAAGGSSADTDFPFMGPGQEGTAETLEDASYYILITGGTLIVDAGGDGLDSNGAFFMEDGTVIVSGPEDSMNGALDYTTTGQITGGTLIACGASGMAQNFDSSSTQCSLLYNFDETFEGGTTVSLTDADGNEFFAEMPKSFNSVVISTPDMQVGETYTLTCGDTSVEVELTDTITALGSGGFGGGPGGFGGPGGGPGGPPPGF